MTDSVLLTKWCYRCDEHKPRSDFYKHKGRPDGLTGECRSCTKLRMALRWKDPRTKAMIKSNSARHAKTEKFRIAALAWKKANLQKIKESVTKSIKKYNANPLNAGKLKARKKLSNAIGAGVLPRARTLKCKVCSNAADSYHHHKGYEPEFQLDVVPLCRKCHHEAEPTKKGSGVNANCP